MILLTTHPSSELEAVAKETMTKEPASRRGVKRKIANDNAPSSNKKTKTKRVTFHEQPKTLLARTHSDNGMDGNACWYTEADYTAFENDCKHTIAAFQNAQALYENKKEDYRLHPQEFTAQGLEDVVSTTSQHGRLFRKERHRIGVLMEYHTQKAHGMINPHRLAAISHVLSTESCLVARRRGDNNKDY